MDDPKPLDYAAPDPPREPSWRTVGRVIIYAVLAYVIVCGIAILREIIALYP